MQWLTDFFPNLWCTAHTSYIYALLFYKIKMLPISLCHLKPNTFVCFIIFINKFQLYLFLILLKYWEYDGKIIYLTMYTYPLVDFLFCMINCTWSVIKWIFQLKLCNYRFKYLLLNHQIYFHIKSQTELCHAYFSYLNDIIIGPCFFHYLSFLVNLMGVKI